MTDEEAVRAAWPDAEMDPDGGWCIVWSKSAALRLGEGVTPGIAWSEARAFTDERCKQIADVEEEINLIRANIAWFRETGDSTESIGQRILAREHAALAELKKGWKEK